MLIAARLIGQFAEGNSFESFSTNQLLESAIRYQLQIIGEAAGKVSTEFRQAHREIPWERLIGLRHGLVHGYREIELSRIWRVATSDMSKVVSFLESVVPPKEEVTE
jgi:uncharacterized protein with HEPN domain